MNRDNYASEATGHWFFYGDSISSEDSVYLFSTASRPVLGPIQPPYPMGTGGSFTSSINLYTVGLLILLLFPDM
jgi:hypothetical protein